MGSQEQGTTLAVSLWVYNNQQLEEGMVQGMETQREETYDESFVEYRILLQCSSLIKTS